MVKAIKSVCLSLAAMFMLNFLSFHTVYANCAVGMCGESPLEVFILYLTDEDTMWANVMVVCFLVIGIVGLAVIKSKMKKEPSK